MILLLSLLGFSISPADSARALVSLRAVPLAAVHYAQMAAGENGGYMVEFAKLLEAHGDFTRAKQMYGLALANTSSEESARWLLNRRQGSSVLDSTLTITVTVVNNGDVTARDVQAVIPTPTAHPPFQELTVVHSDFRPGNGMLFADIDCLAPGDSAIMILALGVIQTPGTSRPIPPAITDETLAWFSETIRSMAVPDVLPGPCLPMSRELSRLASEIGLELAVTGGVVLDDTMCVFHAWNVLEGHGTGIRIDPLQFRNDSLLALGHNPTDVVPLWDLTPTDGYELTLLYQNREYDLEGIMKAEFK